MGRGCESPTLSLFEASVVAIRSGLGSATVYIIVVGEYEVLVLSFFFVLVRKGCGWVALGGFLWWAFMIFFLFFGNMIGFIHKNLRFEFAVLCDLLLDVFGLD